MSLKTNKIGLIFKVLTLLFVVSVQKQKKEKNNFIKLILLIVIGSLKLLNKMI